MNTTTPTPAYVPTAALARALGVAWATAAAHPVTLADFPKVAAQIASTETVPETAARLGISTEAVRDRIDSGSLPSVRLFGQVRVLLAQIPSRSASIAAGLALVGDEDAERLPYHTRWLALEAFNLDLATHQGRARVRAAIAAARERQ